MTPIAVRLERIPGPMWIALVILGFVLWWPLGVVALMGIAWSGSMKCCGFGIDPWNRPARTAGENRSWLREPRTSGNQAFDEYRAETLRRLEEEQLAFQDFLYRLRLAKDRAEFDQFMAERATLEESKPPAKR